MGRIPVLVLTFAVAVALSMATPASAETKWVRGTVTAVSGDSITVKADTDMTFKIDKTTDIVGTGLGTKTRQAQAAGKPGVAPSELFKVGEGVEVHYDPATMKATEIRTGISARGTSEAKEPAEKKGSSARGTVTAVTPDSITIKTATGDQTFMVDKTTTVVGRGLGTMSREKAAEGKATTLSDTIKSGDIITVSYHDMAGKMHATEIRVINQAK